MRDEGLPASTLGPLDPDSVELAKTASRRVLGVINEMALHCRYGIGAAGGLGGCDASNLNRALRRSLHTHGGDYVYPIELAAHRSSDT